MAKAYEELDRRVTPLGELLLRRRRLPGTERTVDEILLDGAHLMSSLVHASEEALTQLALAAIGGEDLDVLVGGLGLGHTAAAALGDDRVRTVTVVERLGAVIAWHEEGLVELGPVLRADGRCRFVEADFFTYVNAASEASYDAVLVDIDHSPRALLSPEHAAFYEAEGLKRLAAKLREDGVFALWSADVTDAAFLERLDRVFAEAHAEEITFENPLADATEVNTIYVARSRGGSPAAP